MIDYHIHTDLSADCKISMKDMAQAAQDRGLKEVCFTEHIDLDMPGAPDFVIDFQAYRETFDAVVKEYPGLTLRKGIEAGLDMQTKDRLPELLAGQDIDYVIGSQHIVFGCDPFYQQIWDRYTQRQAFEEYLRISAVCAAACDFYDVFGHLGYISKFCPCEDKLLRYSDYTDAVDTLLKTLVDKGKGLEINTNGLYMTPATMPEAPIIRRYFELGGRIVTVGSDAHYESVVGHAVDETLEMLKTIGFKYVCAFDRRKPRFIPIP